MKFTGAQNSPPQIKARKKRPSEIRTIAANEKAFSLIEVMFATAIMCVMFFAMTSQFISSKKLHYGSTEYLNKVYLAETMLKLLKDQVHTNPNFFININNTYVKKSITGDKYIYKGFLDEMFNDPIASEDFNFEISDVPVIRREKEGSKSFSYYFGFYKVEDISNIDNGSDKTANVLLNVRDLEKYVFDLKIENEKGIALEGILKNITVAVKSTVKNDMPFTVTTKVLCPPESLHSITYNNFQRNLFQDSQIELKKNIDNLLPKNLDDTIKTGFIEKIYENILNLLKPTGKVSELAAYYYDQNKVPYLKKIGDNPAMEKAITELIRQAFFILYVLDYNRYIQTTVYDSRIAQILKDGPNTKLSTDNVKELITLYTDKAQLALQSIDLIQNPFNQLYLGLQKGTEDTQSIVLACFLTAAKGYPVDSNKNIIEAFKSEIPEIKNSFTDNGTLKALEKVNALLSSKLASLTPAEIFKYNKQMIAFNQLSQIISSVKPGGAANTTPPEVTANINTLKNKFSAEKFNAALAYLSTEEKKIKNMDELINEKFCVVRDKIKYFDRVNNLFTQMNATTETIIVALQVGIAGDLSKLTEPKIMWKLYRAKKKSLKDGGKAFVAMIDNDIKNFITKEYGVSVDEYTAICDAWEAANPGSDPTEAFIKQWKKDREEENNRKNNIFGW